MLTVIVKITGYIYIVLTVIVTITGDLYVLLTVIVIITGRSICSVKGYCDNNWQIYM